jgi:hypothetical protein
LIELANKVCAANDLPLLTLQLRVIGIPSEFVFLSVGRAEDIVSDKLQRNNTNVLSRGKVNWKIYKIACL